MKSECRNTTGDAMAVHDNFEEWNDCVDNGSVGMHCVDSDGIIIWANKTELDFLGYERDEFIGHAVADFHLDEDVINDILTRLTAREVLEVYPARLRAKDGSTKYVLINSNVYEENGEFQHTRCFTTATNKSTWQAVNAKSVVGSVRMTSDRAAARGGDTPRTRVTAKADCQPTGVDASSQEILRVIRALSADDFPIRSPVGDLAGDAEEILRELNSLAEKLQSKQEFYGHTQRVLQLKTDLLESTMAELDKANRRLSQEIGFAFIGAQGTLETRSEKSTIVRETGNKLTGIASFDDTLDAWARQARDLIGTHQSTVSYFPHGNIAEGKHAISLSDKYEKYRTYDELPTGVGIWGHVIRQKLSFCLTDEELKSHPAWKNFSDLRDERGLEHPPMRGWLALPVLSREQEFVGMVQLSDKYEGDFTQDDLQRITRLAQLMAPAFSLQYANEQLQRRNDELTNATNALEESNVELERFAYVASHDLQEPMRKIASCCQILQDEYADKFDDDGKEWVGFAVASANRMRTLIRDLLAYSRVGKSDTTGAEVDARSICLAAIENLAASAEETGAKIVCHWLPKVCADQTQLGQLFQNLVGNGLKYRSDAVPEIELGAELKGEFWEFYVKDNGIGIEAEYQDQIFVLFQRLHSKQEYSGTGIGLAICKKIVERAGGNIWVESTLGEGSTFRFTWPQQGIAQDAHERNPESALSAH